MLLTDVNVLVYAANQKHPDNDQYKRWLTDCLSGSEPFGVSELVLSGVIRVLTIGKGYPRKVAPDEALGFVSSIRNSPASVVLRPGPNHWKVFVDLCRQTNARGNTVPDAYHAALAIEHGCEWITADRGFAKFPGLRWRHPLDG